MLRLFSKPTPAGPRPRAKRDSIECSATVCAGNAFHRVKLCDVSKSGCKVAVTAPLPIGERVQIALEAFHSLGGTVRWCRNGMAGIEFARTLNDAALATWRDALEKARSAPPPPTSKFRRNFLGERIRGKEQMID